MRSRRFMVVMGFLLPLCGRAQLGVYGEFSGALTGSTSTDMQGLYGGTFGGYYDSARVGPLHAGLDVRGELLNGSGFGGGSGSSYKIDSFLAGPWVSFRLRGLRVKPYAEFLIGRSSVGFHGPGVSPNSGFAYGPLGGLDVGVAPHFDWRMIEVSYLHGPPPDPYSDGNSKTGVLSTGIVFRF